mmetsp:Transcript_59692/g.185133  ORF Transcript_59692/g.185133 Transcript_59692/m.185133 type:complete len:348 (+) Transcript_59692:577-1620(+)
MFRPPPRGVLCLRGLRWRGAPVHGRLLHRIGCRPRAAELPRNGPSRCALQPGPGRQRRGRRLRAPGPAASGAALGAGPRASGGGAAAALAALAPRRGLRGPGGLGHLPGQTVQRVPRRASAGRPGVGQDRVLLRVLPPFLCAGRAALLGGRVPHQLHRGCPRRGLRLCDRLRAVGGAPAAGAPAPGRRAAGGLYSEGAPAQGGPADRPARTVAARGGRPAAPNLRLERGRPRRGRRVPAHWRCPPSGDPAQRARRAALRLLSAPHSPYSAQATVGHLDSPWAGRRGGGADASADSRGRGVSPGVASRQAAVRCRPRQPGRRTLGARPARVAPPGGLAALPTAGGPAG